MTQNVTQNAAAKENAERKKKKKKEREEEEEEMEIREEGVHQRRRKEKKNQRHRDLVARRDLGSSRPGSWRDRGLCRRPGSSAAWVLS